MLWQMWQYVLACCFTSLRLLLELDSEALSRAAFMLWEEWEEKEIEKQAVGVQFYFWVHEEAVFLNISTYT